jgi:hypothetical protein
VSPSTARTLGEWLANPDWLRAPEIVIPCLAVEGRVSLLSGREKIGKSTLAAGAASAASRGSDVLGGQVPEPIRSIWYATDERVSDTLRRFDAMGAARDGIVINDKPRTVPELLDALAHDLDDFPDVGVVWVDTLSRILASSGVDPNSSREVEPVIAKLVDCLHGENVAGVLLYHTGKGGREYRGSTAIGATVDDVLTLRKRGQADDDDFDDEAADDGRRLLVQDGRNLRGRIQLSFRDGVYRPYEETSSPRERITDALRINGPVIGHAELTKLAGVRKAAGLHAIAELIAEGAIVESGRNLKLPVAPRERTPPALTFPGSTRFPDAGTAPEPTAEPKVPATSLVGSHFCREGVTETGTDSRRTREVNGVRQILRPTQHGDRWFVAEDHAPTEQTNG